MNKNNDKQCTVKKYLVNDETRHNFKTWSKNNTHGVIWNQRWKVPNSSLQKVNPCIKTKLDRVQRLKRSSTGKRSRQQRAMGTGLRPLQIVVFRFTGSNGTHDGSEDDGEHWTSRLLLKELIVNDVDYTLVVVSRWYYSKIGPRLFKRIYEVGWSSTWTPANWNRQHRQRLKQICVLFSHQIFIYVIQCNLLSGLSRRIIYYIQFLHTHNQPFPSQKKCLV